MPINVVLALYLVYLELGCIVSGDGGQQEEGGRSGGSKQRGSRVCHMRT